MCRPIRCQKTTARQAQLHHTPGMYEGTGFNLAAWIQSSSSTSSRLSEVLRGPRLTMMLMIS